MGRLAGASRLPVTLSSSMQALHQHIAKDGFRLRGTEMSRIDGFSDVVFGFALTLLVVSLEVPRTFDEFQRTLLGFIPFSICFVFFVLLWWGHFRFFRRYGLHDNGTILINCVLLFTVLFYVYPLKFLFMLATVRSEVPVFTSPGQARELVTVYSLGFSAIYFCFVALYANAWRLRDELALNPLERVLTRGTLWHEFGTAFVGLLVCVVAQLLPAAQATRATLCFILILPWSRLHNLWLRKRIRAARALSELSATPVSQEG